MGAHEAGRVACHASSPEWAVKSATCTYFSTETAAFVSGYFYFKKRVCCFYTTWPLFGAFLLFTFNITAFAENRITPPSPHCLRLWSVLPCCVASRTVFCCRDRLQFTDETREGEHVVDSITQSTYAPRWSMAVVGPIKDACKHIWNRRYLFFWMSWFNGYHFNHVFYSVPWFSDTCSILWLDPRKMLYQWGTLQVNNNNNDLCLQVIQNVAVSYLYILAELSTLKADTLPWKFGALPWNLIIVTPKISTFYCKDLAK